MVQKFTSPVRIYKYPFELVMKVSTKPPNKLNSFGPQNDEAGKISHNQNRDGKIDYFFFTHNLVPTKQRTYEGGKFVLRRPHS